MTVATYNFTNRLATVIANRDVLLRDLAERLGWPEKRLRRLRSGETRPSLEDVERLAEVLHVDPRDLAFGPKEK